MSLLRVRLSYSLPLLETLRAGQNATFILSSLFVYSHGQYFALLDNLWHDNRTLSRISLAQACLATSTAVDREFRKTLSSDRTIFDDLLVDCYSSLWAIQAALP